MSTIYDFDEKNGIDAIETHYFNDGYDVEGFVEDGDVIIICATGEFSEDYVNNVEDVFMGNMTTYVVANVPDDDSNTILLEVYEMSTGEFYAKWELPIRKSFYHRKDHTNEWVWFNIGQNGDYFVQWQDAVINGNFDPDSIRLETCDDSENEIWVKPDDPRVIMPRTVDGCFDDLVRVAKAVEDSYWKEHDVHFEGRNSLHIREVFDMDDVNEYGVGKSLWESY